LALEQDFSSNTHRFHAHFSLHSFNWSYKRRADPASTNGDYVSRLFL
jgi:hypothetical protein